MYIHFKRIVDFILATAGIAVLSPVLIAIAVLIKREDNGPIFYRGERVGLHGMSFRVFKFRSMVVNADKIGPDSTSETDPRITKIGAFLRAKKLDELPQLFNVWLGDMSFVGPRPEVRKFTDLYTEEEKELLLHRPGITDFASIEFSNEGEILKAHEDEYPDADAAYAAVIRPEKIRLQLKYIHNISLMTDITIIIKTLLKIIR